MLSLKNWAKTVPAIRDSYLYGRSVVRCWIDAFSYCELSFNENSAEQAVHQDVGYDVDNNAVANMTSQRKYDYVLPLIEDGVRVLDIACGAGELQEVLRAHGKKVEYWGIDYDAQRIKVGQDKGRQVFLLNCSNLAELKDFIYQNGPFDVICCIYAFYFFPNPEAFLAFLHGKARRVILGCWNGGHWSYRMRYLFGRGPRPSIYYSTRQSNYEEMRRYWTLRDHQFIFDSLRYKSRMLAVKSEATSRHYRPQWFPFASSRAKSFIFLLEPRENR